MKYILSWIKAPPAPVPLFTIPAAARSAPRSRNSPSTFPKSGWVEHDAEEIWQSVLATAREAIKKAGVEAKDIAGIGITNQRETVVVWDRKTGKPLHRAIVWQDRRTSDYMSALREAGKEALIQQKAGLLLDPYFSASKFHWLLRAIPEARKRAEDGEICAGTIDSWLDVQAQQREVARHRRHQRFAHDADEYPHRRLGRPIARALRHPALGASRRSSQAAVRLRKRTPRTSARRFPFAASPATSRPRSLASSAPSPAW